MMRLLKRYFLKKIFIKTKNWQNAQKTAGSLVKRGFRLPLSIEKQRHEDAESPENLTKNSTFVIIPAVTNP